MKLRLSLYALMLGLASLLALTSCNDDDDNNNSSSIYTAASATSTEVSAFTLGTNDSVLAHLDSVYFTIDQQQCLIYNADSLPVGTDVSKLTATITFPNTVSKAQLHVTGGTVMADTTWDYTSTTKDSIDFTGRVELLVTSANGQYNRTYVIKVNVHKMEPDSLHWNLGDRRDLPGINNRLVASKTAQRGSGYVTLVHDANRYVLAETANLGVGSWSQKVVTFPFTPRVESFAATTAALYVLDEQGNLYSSTDDGSTWTAAGVQWATLIGGYNDTEVLGVAVNGTSATADVYPRPEGYQPQVLPDSFPVTGSSQLVPASNEWTIKPQYLIACGRKIDGNLTNTTWGFDGEQWGEVTSTTSSLLYGLEQPIIVPYYTFSTNSTTHRTTKQVTWLLMGGRKADGSLNRTTFVSYNQGISWSTAGTLMLQPSYMPSFYGAQAFVEQETLTGAKARRRAGGIKPVSEWQCPYIFLLGGRGESGDALPYVWKGVISRLTFKPLY